MLLSSIFPSLLLVVCLLYESASARAVSNFTLGSNERRATASTSRGSTLKCTTVSGIWLGFKYDFGCLCESDVESFCNNHGISSSWRTVISSQVNQPSLSSPDNADDADFRHRLVLKAAFISTPITPNPSVTAPVVTLVVLSRVPPMANVAPPLATLIRLLPTVAVVLVVRLTKTASAAVLSAASVTVPNALLPSLAPHTPLTESVVLPVPSAGLATGRFVSDWL